jgi:hypothetical protein
VSTPDTRERPTPPPLELLTPLCSVCTEHTTHETDVGFVCQDCGITWPETGVGSYDGEWNAPDAERCDAIDGRFMLKGSYGSRQDPTVRRCWLAAGHHTREHAYVEGRIAPYTYHWRDRDQATPWQLEWAARSVAAGVGGTT